MAEAQLFIDLLSPFLSESGVFLVDLKLVAGKKISVFADRMEGLSIEDCALISRFLSTELEKRDLDFEIEVSSPGIDTPFKVVQQFQKAVGRSLVIHTHSSHIHKGKLTRFVEVGVFLIPEKSTKKQRQTEVVEVFLPFSEIRTAKELLNFK